MVVYYYDLAPYKRSFYPVKDILWHVKRGSYAYRNPLPRPLPLASSCALVFLKGEFPVDWKCSAPLGNRWISYLPHALFSEMDKITFTLFRSTTRSALLEEKKGRSTLAPGTAPAMMVIPSMVRTVIRIIKFIISSVLNWLGVSVVTATFCYSSSMNSFIIV